MSEINVAILLGRKGSKGLPDKNVMSILGRPAMHYPILAAKHSRYVDKMYVSSDDERIFEEASKFDLERIDRPLSLCTDEALFEDALEHAYFEVIEKLGNVPKYVVILMCNAVTVDAELIDQAIELLETDEKADSAVTVTKFNMYSPLRARKLDDNNYLKPFVPFDVFGDPANLNCDRDSQGDSLFADMSHSVVRSRCLENIMRGLLPQRWMGQNILPIYNTMGCDIDEPWQLDMSVRWLKEKGFTKTRTPYD
jgi:CMP-N-acetylneuraminic acid synthetase